MKTTGTVTRGGPVTIRVVATLLLVTAAGVFGRTMALAKDGGPPGAGPSGRMADGREWTTENLSVDTAGSYCYDDALANCRRYARLYTWDAAQRGCRSLGERWRLPTEDEWRRLARSYGGVSEDSADGGKTAYAALLTGGRSGFGALLGGGRSESGDYARLEAHGFYWTASACDEASAWFYNFGKGGRALHRQREGEKGRAFSVRCIKE